MAPYLLEHRNPFGDAFYRSRRGTVLAYVVHVTAGLEDLDGVDDHSAEKTAAYAASTDRRVSWHAGSDADSVVELLPAGFTAFHVAGYNSRTYGHEISKAVTDWREPVVSATWTEASLRQAARWAAARALELGIPIRRASKAELDREIAKGAAGRPVGFVSHGELDPTRRSDPGFVGRARLDTFPWARFLALVALYARPTAANPPPVTVRFSVSDLATTFLEIGPANGFGLARGEWDPHLDHPPTPVSCLLHGPDPEAGDGWWTNSADARAPRAQERAGKIVVTLGGLKPGTSTFVFLSAV